MFGRDPDRDMIDFGLCTFCIGRGCPMCEGTGEHEEKPLPEEIKRMTRYEVQEEHKISYICWKCEKRHRACT